MTFGAVLCGFAFCHITGASLPLALSLSCPGDILNVIIKVKKFGYSNIIC